MEKSPIINNDKHPWLCRDLLKREGLIYRVSAYISINNPFTRYSEEVMDNCKYLKSKSISTIVVSSFLFLERRYAQSVRITLLEGRLLPSLSKLNLDREKRRFTLIHGLDVDM